MRYTIGILGGMGPMATVDLFEKVILNTKASSDQEHIHIIINNNPKIPSRMKAIMEGGGSPLPELSRSLRVLEAAGVNIIAIACNTAHYWIEELQQITSVPIINMINNTAQYLKEKGSLTEKYLLLSTQATIKVKLYQDAFMKQNINLTLPSKDEQILIDSVINEVKAGNLTCNSYLPVLKDLLNNYKENGVVGIIGGCTEIPLLFPYLEVELEKIDPTELLAKKLVSIRKTKEGL